MDFYSVVPPNFINYFIINLINSFNGSTASSYLSQLLKLCFLQLTYTTELL